MRLNFRRILQPVVRGTKWLYKSALKWILSRGLRDEYARPANLLSKENHEKQNPLGALSFVVLVGLYPTARRLSKSASESSDSRFAKPEARKEQCRLRLCLPENQVLFLHDRGERRRALRLWAQRRAGVESSAARQRLGERKPRGACEVILDLKGAEFGQFNLISPTEPRKASDRYSLALTAKTSTIAMFCSNSCDRPCLCFK